MAGKWHGGKGSNPRPFSVSQDEFDNRWDAIFGKKEKTNGRVEEQKQQTQSSEGQSPNSDNMA